MQNKIHPYFTLVNHGESMTGVGGYELLKHDDISGAAKEISKFLIEVKDDWWSCIDNIETDIEWMSFNASIEKISNEDTLSLTDQDLFDVSFECGCYYSVLFAGNTKEIIQEILQYLLDNTPNAIFDDDEEYDDDETTDREVLYDSEMSINKFRNMSLRKRLKIISAMVTKDDDSYIEYLGQISFDDLYIC